MSDFDPSVPLTMAKFKTVHGHNLNAGTALVIAASPVASGEVTEDMARRLYLSGAAVPADDFRPTPVETPVQEAARLAKSNAALAEEAEALGVEPPLPEIPADLQVTKARLLEIAAEEEVAVESDDNKPDLQAKIIAARAAKAEVLI